MTNQSPNRDTQAASQNPPQNPNPAQKDKDWQNKDKNNQSGQQGKQK